MDKFLPKLKIKQIATFSLSLLLSTPIFAQGSFDFEADNIPYKITGSESVSVVRDEGGPDRYRYTGNVVIPATVTYNDQVYKVTAIGEGAFTMEEEMTGIQIGENVTTIGMTAFFNCKKISSLTIPSNVKTIKHGAFIACIGINEITIEEGVNTINGGAFSGCGFATVTLPASAKYLDNGILASCPNLEEIKVAEGNPTFKSIDGILYNTDGTILWQYPAGKPETEFIIPAHVTTLFESSFEGLEHLKKITIPATVTKIDDAVFAQAQSFTDIYCEAENPIYLANESVFDPTTFTKAILHVPDNAVKAYKTANIWSKFAEIMGFNDVEVETITIDPNKKDIIRGETFQLNAICLPDDATYKTVLWSSDNEEVAEVNQKGLVTAIEVGSCTITASTPSGKVKGICTITVTDEFDSIESINANTFSILVSESNLIINGAENEIKEVYNASGIKVYSGTDNIIGLTSGLYIVTINGKAMKVAL